MHPAVQQAVRYQLGTVFDAIESGRKAVVSPNLRSFMADLVFESLEVRENEWMKLGFDPNSVGDSEKIASQVSNVVRFIAGEAPTYKSSEGPTRVLLIGVLQLMHNKWCGIFPFCR